MPILDKMYNNEPPDDDPKRSQDDIKLDRTTRRPQPKFLSASQGRRQVSLAALVERITDQFRAEYPPRVPELLAAQTRTDRLKLLRPVVDYVVNVESMMLDSDEFADVVRIAYSEIFGFGPLDRLIDDPTITTITLEGDTRISVRHGHGELEQMDPIFEDKSQFREIVGRLLQRSGAVLLDNLPLIEVGCLAENGRFLSISVAAPPITFELSLDIRLHPLEAPTLTGLVERGTMTDEALRLLMAIVQSEHGFMVVGQPESGKTMTLSAMLAALPNPEQSVAVERTGEIHLPASMTRFIAEWPQKSSDDGVTFGEQIDAQRDKGYQTIVLDEVRADEPHSIAPLLKMEIAPRMIWSFRGAPDSKRLVASLGMLARRGDIANGEMLVRNLFERIPFVISVRRLNSQIQIREVGEWYYVDGIETVRYRPLLENVMGEMALTGKKPSHPLPTF